MKQISSLELGYLINELSLLVNSRIDKVYQAGKEELLIQFYVHSKGKKFLRIIVGKAMFLTDIKEEYDEPSDFCMFLRKKLSNSKLSGINQKESERIVELVFEKEETRKLIIEFFGGGNIILCDKEDTILLALIYHKFKERSILPKVRYGYPRSKINLFELELNKLREIFKKSDKENIVKCLAVDVGLGGVYSEEICLLSKIDKSKKPVDVDNKEIKKIFDNINGIITKELNPFVVYDGAEIIDVVPFDIKFYESYAKKKFDTFSRALEFYFSKFVEKKPSKYEKQLEKLKDIIKKQELRIKELEEKELDERKKAELIYNHYSLIKEIIEKINKASEKRSWKEIKEKLKGHKVVKEVDGKEKKIVLEIE